MERTALESIPEQVVLTEEAPLEEQQPPVVSEGESAPSAMETPTGDRVDEQERARGEGEGEGEGEDRPTPLTVHARGEEMHEEMQPALPNSSSAAAPAAPLEEEQTLEPVAISTAIEEAPSASATPKKKKQRRGFWYRLLHFFGAPKHESAEGEAEAEGVTEEDAGKASSSAVAAKGEKEAETDREESFESQGKPAAAEEQVLEAVKHAEEDVDERSTKEQGMT